MFPWILTTHLMNHPALVVILTLEQFHASSLGEVVPRPTDTQVMSMNLAASQQDTLGYDGNTRNIYAICKSLDLDIPMEERAIYDTWLSCRYSCAFIRDNLFANGVFSTLR